MNDARALSLVLLLAVVLILWLYRRRWMNLSCVGVFTVFFLVMNYVGVLLTIWGYPWRTYFRMPNLVPLMTGDQLVEAVVMVNLGFFFLWSGILVGESVLGVAKIHGNLCAMDVNLDNPLGIGLRRLVILGVVASLVFLVLFAAVAGPFFSLVGQGSAAEQLEYRLAATANRPHYALTLVGYNVLAYFAVCGFVCFLKLGKLRYLAFLPLALLGKLVYMHKEPFVVFLVHLGVLWVLLRGRNHRRAVTQIATVLCVAFLVLPVLYMVFLGYRGHEVTIGAYGKLALSSAERILGRVSNSYFYFAHFFPEHFDFMGLSFVKTLSLILGTEHMPINKLIYGLIEGNQRGSVPADNFAYHYGGFGFPGVALVGFFQGFVLAGIDRWFSNRPATLGWFVLYSFMVMLMITLNQAHMYGVALGYGGAIFVVLALALNTFTDREDLNSSV
jgi:hypothetical protein